MRNSAAFLFFIGYLAVAFAAEDVGTTTTKGFSNLAELSQSLEWRRLLHYEPTVLGGWVSRARTQNFFVAENGYDHPESEIEALANRLQNTEGLIEKNRDDHPRCRFPARSAWLAEKLKLKIPDESWCPRLSEWKQKVRAKSVTYVFSSYYVNNPSSTFGHTLLRLNRQDLLSLSRDSEGRQLLDFGANYGVTPTTKNPILYGVFALAGLFPGNFMVLPYFYKVREYNDYESRDLWEYDLRLSPDEVDRMTNHLWELVSTQYSYHYLTDNCGYQVLSVIETAAPRLNLTEKLRTWVIPSDTVRILAEADLVEHVHFRPSIRTQFNARRKRLATVEESEALARLAVEPLNDSVLSPLTREGQARVLDAAIDLVDLNNAHEILLEDSPIKKVKDAMLIKRSRLPRAEELNLTLPKETSPLEGHPSGRLKVAQIFDRERTESELGYRGALHDFLDPENGYPAYTRIEMGTFRLRYNHQRAQVRFEEFQLFAIESLNPWADYFHKPAWRSELHLIRDRDLLCDNCLRGRFNAAVGLSRELHSRFLVYGLIQGEFQTSPGFERSKSALGLGPVAGLLWHITDRLAFLSEGREIYFWHNRDFELWPEWQSHLRYFWHRRWAIEAGTKMSRAESAWEAAVEAYF